jgi:hypothetical protein
MRFVKKSIVYLIVLVILGISCGGRNIKKIGVSKNDTSLNNQIKKDSEELDSLSSLLINKNKVGVLKINFNQDTLSLVSDGDLTWNFFGVSATPKELKKKYTIFSSERDTMFYNTITKKSNSGIILTSSSSYFFFKKLDNQELNQQEDTEYQPAMRRDIQLHYAILKDSITLAYGIKLGMSKKEFFNMIFGYYEIDLINRINVIMNSDPAGDELDVYFLFKKEILNEIIIKSVY